MTIEKRPTRHGPPSTKYAVNGHLGLQKLLAVVFTLVA